MSCKETWTSKRLLDVIDFNPKETLRKGQRAKKIAMEQLRPFSKTPMGYCEEFYNGGAKFKNGDTLLARITPCLENGKTAQVNELEDGEVGFGSTEYIVLRAKEGKSDKDFVYYLSISPNFRSIAIKSMVGSSGRQRVQQNVLENAEFLLPDLKTQKKISAILGVLDNKIELNEKINQNLEAQAQAIFKSWFVDFEPFGGKMPNDWEETSITNIAEYLNGLPSQKYQPDDKSNSYSVLKIRELRLGRCDDVSDRCTCNIPKEYIIKDGDIIFSWSGTLCLDIWCGGNCALNQHLFKVYSPRYDKWFYYFWTKHYMNRFAQIASSKKTTMGHIKRSDLSDAKVFVPSQDYYTLLNGIITPMVDKIIALRCESRRLAQLRDTLLPKLMSGEIDVSDVAV